MKADTEYIRFLLGTVPKFQQSHSLDSISPALRIPSSSKVLCLIDFQTLRILTLTKFCSRIRMRFLMLKQQQFYGRRNIGTRGLTCWERTYFVKTLLKIYIHTTTTTLFRTKQFKYSLRLPAYNMRGADMVIEIGKNIQTMKQGSQKRGYAKDKENKE